MEVRDGLKYTESHEWVDPADDEALKIGITDHAQGQLGDLVFVELPAVGDEFDQGDACAVVESVKAASDIYAPVAGEVVAVNEALEDDPGAAHLDVVFEVEMGVGDNDPTLGIFKKPQGALARPAAAAKRSATSTTPSSAWA